MWLFLLAPYIYLTVNRVTHPVSTEFFALGLSKTMLWSDDPSSEIVTVHLLHVRPYFV